MESREERKTVFSRQSDRYFPQSSLPSEGGEGPSFSDFANGGKLAVKRSRRGGEEGGTILSKKGGGGKLSRWKKTSPTISTKRAAVPDEIASYLSKEARGE